MAIYRTSWTTYQIAKRLVRVKFLAMPNLLAGEQVYPELIQHAASPENIAREALRLMQDEVRRDAIKGRLKEVVRSLGDPGAGRRAAEAICACLEGRMAGGKL